jgi:hypothetical protein
MSKCQYSSVAEPPECWPLGSLCALYCNQFKFKENILSYLSLIKNGSFSGEANSKSTNSRLDITLSYLSLFYFKKSIRAKCK